MDLGGRIYSSIVLCHLWLFFCKCSKCGDQQQVIVLLLAAAAIAAWPMMLMLLHVGMGGGGRRVAALEVIFHFQVGRAQQVVL